MVNTFLLVRALAGAGRATTITKRFMKQHRKQAGNKDEMFAFRGPWVKSTISLHFCHFGTKLILS